MADGLGVMVRALVVPWALFWGAMIYSVVMGGRSPSRHPSRVSERKKHLLVATGASATHGRVSHDWVHDLDGRLGSDDWTCLNLGVNGRRVTDVLRSLDQVIALKPEVVVVMVGVNDVNGFTPVERYRATMARVVERLKSETSARVGLCTLTAIGDDPGGAVMKRAAPFNEAIRQVAAEQKVGCIDVAAAQIAWLEAHGRRSGRGMVAFLPLMFSAILQHYALRRGWDAVSRTHGLALTTDLVHQNSQGGAIITDLVERFVRASG